MIVLMSLDLPLSFNDVTIGHLSCKRDALST